LIPGIIAVVVSPIYTGEMSTSLPRIAILGTGNMGGAILSGLLGPKVTLEAIRVTTRSAGSAATLAARGVEARSLEEDPDANAWALEGADMVILGVKPHQILELLEDIRPLAKPDAIMISIAAGITLEAMESVWPGAVIRTMPNTPSQVGKGVTGVSRGSMVTDAEQELALGLFRTVGEVIVVDEAHLNALSSLSGSGPAYVYFFIERFIDVAIEYGFSSEQAAVMVQGTFTGAMELLERSHETPGSLRQAVTSPGGTTEAALAVFGAANLGDIIRRATDAAIARASALATD